MGACEQAAHDAGLEWAGAFSIAAAVDGCLFMDSQELKIGYSIQHHSPVSQN